jgi:hypothetical protein
MLPTVLPCITEAEFPSFQALIPELQKVLFTEWEDDHRKAVAYRQLRNGSTNVPVCPVAFAAWLRETGEPAHLELLWAYAEEQAVHDLLAVKTFSRAS